MIYNVIANGYHYEFRVFCEAEIPFVVCLAVTPFIRASGAAASTSGGGEAGADASGAALEWAPLWHRVLPLVAGHVTGVWLSCLRLRLAFFSKGRVASEECVCLISIRNNK